MSLYNEYLTGSEREAAIIVAESEAQFAKLNILFEAVDATLGANMLAAEAKVFAENGTYDDLTMLYKEAGEEAVQKKQGIIATIINAIANLFTKIGNFINNKFGKQLENIPEGDVKVDSRLEKEMNVFKKAWDFLKSPIDKIKAGTDAGLDKEDIAKAWGQLAAEFAAISGTAAGVTTIVVKREKILEWIKTVSDEIHKKVTAAIAALKTALGIGKVVKNVVDNKKDESSDSNNEGDATEPKKESFGDKLLGAGQKVLDALKTFGNWIATWIGKLAASIGLTKKEAEKEADASTTAKEDSKEEVKEESVSLFGISLESEETFLETEMTDEEYSELCELFADI